MITSKRRSLAIASLLVFGITAVFSTPAAANDSRDAALVLLAASSILISAGTSVANAIALKRGAPSRPNGWFGVGVGTFSVLFASTVYIASGGERTSGEFAAVLGSAGVASIVFGALNVRAAGAQSERTEANRRVSLEPYVAGLGQPGLGLALKISL